MRHGLIIYDSWARLILGLPDAQAVELFRAMLSYSFDGIEPDTDDKSVKAMFEMMRVKMDEDAAAWERTRQARSEAGKKGMSSRWGNNSVITHDNSVITRDNSVKESITPVTKSSSISISKDKKKDIERKAFVPPTLDEVRAYCTERNSAVNPQTFYDYYTEGKWRDSSGKPVKSWKQKLITWEKSEPRRETKSKTNKFNQFEQNSYDFEELERKLISN